MNVFASLESILKPIGEVESPVVGLQVEDIDDNVRAVSQTIVDMGYAVQVLGKGEYSAESVVTFQYEGLDGTDDCPVLRMRDGYVMVHQGEGEEVSLEHYLDGLK